MVRLGLSHWENFFFGFGFLAFSVLPFFLVLGVVDFSCGGLLLRWACDASGTLAPFGGGNVGT